MVANRVKAIWKPDSMKAHHLNIYKRIGYIVSNRSSYWGQW